MNGKRQQTTQGYQQQTRTGMQRKRAERTSGRDCIDIPTQGNADMCRLSQRIILMWKSWLHVIATVSPHLAEIPKTKPRGIMEDIDVI